ncbi:uncharacterized protein [Chamaea fasciata]|uniref:uncharacterized protein isoform X2 n=1 Tax=Chamaea fasciata TaxID=190680 RepID=UPI00336A85C2
MEGLQLRARARTWRMCRQTEREPGEEKPKWIHSLSWMEEERRREGDVRASFNCLCPVKSAQTPGAAPGSGVRADFRVELPIKPLAATTLLWHRHRVVAPFRTLSAARHSPKEKWWRPPYTRRDPPSVPGSHILARCYKSHVTTIRGKYLFEETSAISCAEVIQEGKKKL